MAGKQSGADRLIMVSHIGQEDRTIRVVQDWLDDVRTHHNDPVLVELKVSRAPDATQPRE